MSATNSPLQAKVDADNSDHNVDLEDIEGRSYASSKLKKIMAASKFNLYTAKEVTFDAIIEPKLSYFAEDGTSIYENINPIATFELQADNAGDTNKKLYDVPVDDLEARALRIEAFEAVAKRKTMKYDGFDDFDPILIDDESIIATIDCAEISGIPASTSNSLIRGFVKVSLVKSNDDGYRLFFSVAEGSIEISVAEEFKENQKSTGFICCFMHLASPKTGKNFGLSEIKSSMRMDYNSSKLFTAQFCSLPLAPCLIDSMCYRSSANEFHAQAAEEGGGGGNSCDWNCCNVQCTCLVCKCGTCPVCCGFDSSSASKSIKFHAHERFQMGGDKSRFPPIVNSQTEEMDGVEWTINSRNEDNVYIVIHYRSLLDGNSKTCKMRLVKSDDSAEAYLNARTFVSLLGSCRNKMLGSYFAHVAGPNMVVDPVSGAVKLLQYTAAAPSFTQPVKGVSATTAAAGGVSIFGLLLGTAARYNNLHEETGMGPSGNNLLSNLGCSCVRCCGNFGYKCCKQQLILCCCPCCAGCL